MGALNIQADGLSVAEQCLHTSTRFRVRRFAVDLHAIRHRRRGVRPGLTYRLDDVTLAKPGLLHKGESVVGAAERLPACNVQEEEKTYHEGAVLNVAAHQRSGAGLHNLES